MDYFRLVDGHLQHINSELWGFRRKYDARVPFGAAVGMMLFTLALGVYLGYNVGAKL